MEKASATTALTERIAALSENMHLTEVRLIETAAICPNPYESPKKFAPADIRALSEELKTKGMPNPLLIQNTGTREKPFYQLVCGEKRFRAALLADMRQVPCVVIERNSPPSPDTRDIPIPRDCFEEADVLSDILSGGRATKNQLAAKLGISLVSLENKLMLCTVTPEERKILVAADISARHSLLFARVSPDLRKKIITDILQAGAHGEAAQDIIGRYSNGAGDKNRKIAIHDTKPFFNSVDKAISLMRAAGINIRLDRTERQTDTVLTITVPK